MLRYRNDDATCFELLYQRYRTTLYSYLMHQCGNQATTDELFQETWASLIQARKTYTDSALFKTYLFRIAHNKLIDHYRRNSKASLSSYEDSDGFFSGNCSPEEQLSFEQQQQQFQKLISQLPEAQREAFLLREQTGLSLEDIARISGTNRETIKSRLRYAINRLRQGMGEQK